ncbi:major facilitator superfamily domain-containing protein [Roridomyces roridus]|uniref:Major facilitator superfamily domain-containing protein n=1 Tax=Roridomyces roridus TaxID=1738132 RepID=A0AAD7C306_9AGAR|nr:major facilitator superfamily domain-containing protein [Roridomyces roridus]
MASLQTTTTTTDVGTDVPPVLEEKGVEMSTTEPPTEYPTGLKFALLIAAQCLSVFVLSLDNTIIATAIPHITDQFGSLDDVGWYGSAYLLTLASTQLLFGKFYSFLPLKWVYVTAIVLFEAGSLLSAAAPNSTALIVGRALAGLGGAGIFSGAMLTVANIVPLEKRPMYTGLVGGMYGIASVAGPLAGGAFTDKVSWRWCFYINLPLGAVTLAVIILILKTPPPAATDTTADKTFASRIRLVDPYGTIVFIPAIVCLLLALQWGGSKFPWNSWRIILLFVLFGVLIIIFVGVQIKMGDGATIPPRIVSKRSIWSGAFFAFCLGSAFFILTFYLPLWFQAIHGVSAVHSGIDNLPIILSVVVASLVAGAVITVHGYYTPWMLLSSVVTAIGAGLISTLKTTSGHSRWLPFEIVCGLGLGFGMQQPMLTAQAVLDMSDVPIGTSIMVFSQTLGGALFVSIGQNVFTNKLVQGLVKNVPGIDPSLVLAIGATDLRDAIQPQFVPEVLEVYNQALVAAFYVSIAMAGLSLFGALLVEWKSIKVKSVEVAGSES